MTIKKIANYIYGRDYKDKLDEKILNNRILWLFVMVLILWNGVNSLTLMSIKEKNHVKAQFPPVNYVGGVQEIGENYANKKHVKAWGMYLIINLRKFDRDDIQEKINEIANRMTHERYVEKKISIDEFVKNVETNKIVAKFRINNDEWKAIVMEDNNRYGAKVTRVSVTGDMFKKFGGYEDERKGCEYAVSFFRKGGRTHVEDFSSTCF